MSSVCHTFQGGAIVESWEEQNKPGPPGEQTPQPEARKEKEVPSASEGPSSEQAQTHGKTKKKRSYGSLAEQFIALITLVYAIFAGLQWSTMKEANRLTNKSILLADRPWVGLERIDADFSDSGLELKISIKNTGHSPALNLKARIGAIFTENGFPENPVFPGKEGEKSEAFLGPGQTLVLTRHYEFSGEMNKMICCGPMKAYAGGEIYYSDASGQAHITRICAIYRPGKHWDYCDHYNNAN